MGASFMQTATGSKVKSVIEKMMDSDSVDSDDKEAVAAFLQGDYVPASGQIVGILKNMKDEMIKSLGGIVSEEEAAAAGFAELSAAKKKEIATASSAIESKQVRAGELAVAIVQNKNAAE